MFLENIAAEARMLESADDMTAADTEPRPKKETHYHKPYLLLIFFGFNNILYYLAT